MSALLRLAWLMYWWTILNGPPDPDVIHRIQRIEVKHQSKDERLSGGYVAYNILLQGGINRGHGLAKPDDKSLWGDPNHDFSRMATTYYHRDGPFGQVMERFNWFPGPKNTYWADSRLTASLVGMGAAPLYPGLVPADQLVTLWSEPPIAVVTMYAGTGASYARPWQYLDFYESNPNIVQLSMPKKGQPHFPYIRDAEQRGAFVRVFPGEERKSLENSGPDQFYHTVVLEICPRDELEDLSVNLLTKEGMALLFQKMAPEGILCIHTSNRYINVVPVITDVADSLGFASVVGRDMAPDEDYHHFTTQWVMVARDRRYLARLPEPENYLERVREDYKRKGYYFGNEPFWHTERPTGAHVWTDNSVHSLRDLWHGNDPYVARQMRDLALVIERTLGPLSGGAFERNLYSYSHGFHGVGIGMRKLFNQTADDVQKR
jgi:hypothetical protein